MFSKGNNQDCFLSNGPHNVRDFPKKEKLNAFVVEDNNSNVVIDEFN